MVRRLALGLAAGCLAACQAGSSVPTVRPAGPSGPAAAPPTANVSGAASAGTSAATSAGLPPPPEERIQGTFSSARYGYTWTLPTGWTVTEAPGSGGVHPGEPGLDTFTDGLGTTVTLGVVAVAATQQLASWVCPVVAHLEDFHDEPREAVASLTLGGVAATISTFHFVAPPYRVLELEVEAIRGTQGFFLSWTDTLVPTTPDAGQMTRFRQLLGGFAFVAAS